jgi:chromosome segregation ATPase
MSCMTMQITQNQSRIEEIEQRRSEAIKSEELEELDRQIAELKAKNEQLVRDDKEFHKIVGDAKARTKHKHNNERPRFNLGG